MRNTEYAPSGAVVLRLSGRLTLATDAEPLERLVGQLSRTPTAQIVLDLHDLERVDCWGIGRLVQLHCNVGESGGSLRLAGPTPRLKETLCNLGLLNTLSVSDDVRQPRLAWAPGAPLLPRTLRRLTLQGAPSSISLRFELGPAKAGPRARGGTLSLREASSSQGVSSSATLPQPGGPGGPPERRCPGRCPVRSLARAVAAVCVAGSLFLPTTPTHGATGQDTQKPSSVAGTSRATYPLHVMYFDAAELPTVAVEAMQRELERVLRLASIEVRTIDPHRTPEFDRFRVSILVLPRAPRGRWAHARTMGLATNKAPWPGDYRSIRVFVPNVMRTMRGCGGPLQEPQLGLALGRVAAHELVHVLAPAYGHASRTRTIMSARVDCTVLLRRQVVLDADAIRAVRAGIASANRTILALDADVAGIRQLARAR